MYKFTSYSYYSSRSCIANECFGIKGMASATLFQIHCISFKEAQFISLNSLKSQNYHYGDLKFLSMIFYIIKFLYIFYFKTFYAQHLLVCCETSVNNFKDFK